MRSRAAKEKQPEIREPEGRYGAAREAVEACGGAATVRVSAIGYICLERRRHKRHQAHTAGVSGTWARSEAEKRPETGDGNAFAVAAS